MEFTVLGWPPDGPTLDLDHERFAYARKFVMSDTGKAVAREDGTLLAAVAFSPDRTDRDCLRLRYVTVRDDRRGEGIGPRLLRFTADSAADRGFDDVVIAVNNPYAFEAAYRAGFVYTGESTGVAELVLADATGEDRSAATYRVGLAEFATRDLPEAVEAFLTRTRQSGPPEPVSCGAVDRPADN